MTYRTFDGTSQTETIVDGRFSSSGDIALADGTATQGAIYFADDKNTGIYSPSNDSIAFSTAGTSRLIIASDGKIGVNTTPDSFLHIKTSTNNNLEFEEASGNLRISALNDARDTNKPLEFASSAFSFLTGDATFAGKVKLSAGNDNNYFYLINTTASDADSARYSRMLFQGTQSGGEVSSLAAINGAHDGTGDDEKGILTFRTNDGNDSESPTVRVSIDSAGDTTFTENIILSKLKKVSFRDSGTQRAYIELDSGDDVVYYGAGDTDTNHIFYADAGKILTIQSDGIAFESNKGINFSAVGTGGSSTSSLLDDYEEGTFTPNFTAGAHWQYGTRAGHYVKIGKTVWVSFMLIWTSQTTGSDTVDGSTEIKIGGLPFQVTHTLGRWTASIGFTNGINAQDLALNMSSEYDLFALYHKGSGTAASDAVLAGECAAAGEIIGSGYYVVA